MIPNDYEVYESEDMIYMSEDIEPRWSYLFWVKVC
jgi:hypothetical protein